MANKRFPESWEDAINDTVKEHGHKETLVGVTYAAKLMAETYESELSEKDKMIEELEADKWISVEDRLPEEGIDVLIRICIFSDEYDTVVGNYKKGTWFESWRGEDITKLTETTHWQPLPNPPKTNE